MTWSLLMLGFTLGLKHALEGDHLAAVASMATKQRNFRSMVKVGLVWSLGHALTLLVAGGTLLVLDTVVSARLATLLEFLVGMMLVLLGADVLRRLVRERIHFHVHGHKGAVRHFHAHSHAGETGTDNHEHSHGKGFPLRALLVGCMHGMAGSAALMLLVVSTAQDLASGVTTLVLFGVGSILGMGVLSVAIALPLRYSARHLTGVYNGLSGSVGVITILLGVSLMVRVGVPGSFF